MDLMEFQAKELFLKFGIPAGSGVVFDSLESLKLAANDIEYPAVIKAQVLTGGRGKAGGVKLATGSGELISHAGNIFGLNIKGHTVKRVMTVKACNIEREFYLAVTLDRKNKCPVVIFSKNGGMDIEEVAKTSPDSILKFPVNMIIGVESHIINSIKKEADLSEKQSLELKNLLKNLYKLYLDYDCLLCEINPLALSDGELIALDGKISIDDSALYRHPDMADIKALGEKDLRAEEAEKFNFLFIPYETDGEIAIISNGSGMIMSCIDALAKEGMKVVSSLDLGGGATSERIKEGIRIIFEDKVKYLFINIFGGITRCDEVALGVKLAVEEFRLNKPIILRFEGTNKEEALKIAAGVKNVKYVDGLLQGVEALKDEYFNR